MNLGLRRGLPECTGAINIPNQRSFLPLSTSTVAIATQRSSPCQEQVAVARKGRRIELVWCIRRHNEPRLLFAGVDVKNERLPLALVQRTPDTEDRQFLAVRPEQQ